MNNYIEQEKKRFIEQVIGYNSLFIEEESSVISRILKLGVCTNVLGGVTMREAHLFF